MTESILRSLFTSTLTNVVAFLVPSSLRASTVTIDTFVLAPFANFTSSFGFTLSYTFASLLKSLSVEPIPTFQPESWIAFATVLPVTKPAPAFVTLSVLGSTFNGVPADLPSGPFSNPIGLPSLSTL